MANTRRELFTDVSELATSSCPSVADLIDFALGQTSPPLSGQVRNHLLVDNCNHCRAWIEQAARRRPGPAIDWNQFTIGPLGTSPSPSVPDPTPVPESAKWQRQAIRDLEKRLRLLEES
jgi:hypothetical protein